jgi:hypothetical protein
MFKEQLCEGSGNGATIPKQLASQFFRHLGNRSSIIDVAWSQATRSALVPGALPALAVPPARSRLSRPNTIVGSVQSDGPGFAIAPAAGRAVADQLAGRATPELDGVPEKEIPHEPLPLFSLQLFHPRLREKHE